MKKNILTLGLFLLAALLPTGCSSDDGEEPTPCFCDDNIIDTVRESGIMRYNKQVGRFFLAFILLWLFFRLAKVLKIEQNTKYLLHKYSKMCEKCASNSSWRNLLKNSLSLHSAILISDIQMIKL